MLHQSRYTACAALLVLVVFLANTASAGLVGWWTFDETSGNTAKDSSGQTNDGRVNGTAKWVPGKIGGALEFNGSTFVDCGNKASLNIRGQITMSFWFKVAGFTNTWESFLAKGDGAYRSARSGGTGNATHMGISGSNYFDAVTVVTDNQWHHWAGIYDGTTAKIYLDGKLDATAIYGAPIGDSSAYNLYIGENQQATGRLLHGLMDDVRIYDRALTEEQLLDLINNGTSPSWNKAEKPNPADGATGVAMPLFSWTKGDNTSSHNVYIGTTPELTAANLVGPRWPTTQYYWPNPAGLTPAAVYYWRVDEVGKDGKTIYPGDVWKFTAAPLTSYFPSPRNGDKWIAVDATLSWQPGKGATQHKVYFSTYKDAVANRDASAFKGKQQPSTFDPGALELNTPYYWAVDEVTLTGEVAGELWKFTTVAAFLGGVKGEYYNSTTPSGAPQLTRIDPEINFSWGNDGPGTPIGVDGFSARWTADLEIAIADSYTFITSSDDGVRLWLNDELIINHWTDHGTADDYTLPMDLEPGVYSLRMEYYESGGGAVAQLSWQSPSFARRIIPAGPLQPPVRARALYPQSGDVNLPQELTLMWGAGEKAVKHQIYFGDDADAVAAADPSSSLYKGEQALDETTFNPGQLEWNKKYFWRVDEVNETAEGSPWAGPVWNFTTADFLVVDDMEIYNDEEGTGTRIYETWIDGYTDGLSGSTVGNLNPPFAEQTIVHGGKQSMPMDYNNINSPFYSQAYREFAPLQNWTVNGLSDLVLWVRGNPIPMAPITDDGSGKMTVTGEGTDIWFSADQFTYVFKTLSGDGWISARVTSNGTGTNVWAKGGVMIRDDLTAGSMHASAVITGGAGAGNGGSFQYRPTADTDALNSDLSNPIAPPYYVKVERKGDTLTASFSADGTSWTAQGEPQYMAMSAPAYIGICVTSHVAGELRAFEFDKITTNGATGAWQTREIGLVRNSQQPLYVIVEDSSNKKATVVDPNVTVVNSTQWTEWKIPLTDLKGVSLNKVKRLYIGVGDPLNPAADGTGRVFIDDIRVMKPAATPPQE